MASKREVKLLEKQVSYSLVGMFESRAHAAQHLIDNHGFRKYDRWKLSDKLALTRNVASHLKGIYKIHELEDGKVNLLSKKVSYKTLGTFGNTNELADYLREKKNFGMYSREEMVEKLNTTVYHKTHVDGMYKMERIKKEKQYE